MIVHEIFPRVVFVNGKHTKTPSPNIALRTNLAAEGDLLLISLCSVLGTPFYVMEYARGRLFKDPSLPGMTVEERKVRVESVRRGGGG